MLKPELENKASKKYCRHEWVETKGFGILPKNNIKYDQGLHVIKRKCKLCKIIDYVTDYAYYKEVNKNG